DARAPACGAAAGEKKRLQADKTAFRRRLQEQTNEGAVMPKMKTKKSAAKRLRVRPGGTVKRGQAFKRHLLTKKPRNRKRPPRGAPGGHETNMGEVGQMLPFAGL